MAPEAGKDTPAASGDARTGDLAQAQPARWIELLCDEVGPRRPTGRAEAQAAQLVAARLATAGCRATVEPFDGYPTFAAPYGVGLAVALSAALAPHRRRLWRGALAALGPALIAAEDGLRTRPLSRLLARRPSANVVASIEPRQAASRTVCLVCHLDTSRSGLMFDRRFLPWLHRWIGLQAGALGLNAATAPFARLPGAARIASRAARAVLVIALLLLIERELRGVDVPGANDNASGVAAVATLLTELAADPLERTRVIGLITGCEEAGVLGADAFLRALDAGHFPPGAADRDWRRWAFLNFDGVAAPASLRYLRREGVLQKWGADPGLTALAERISRQRPELGLAGTDHNAGLTYDSTPVLVRGGRAITFSAQDETIPNYHSPTDTVENLDLETLNRALEVGREMLARIDRGEADA